MSQYKLLTAWTAALEGRDSDIPVFDGIDFDPLATLGDPAPPSSKVDPDAPTEEPYILAPKTMSLWKILRFVVNMLWTLLLHRHEETRIAIIPPHVFASLKAAALADLSTASPSLLTPHGFNPSKPFLSDGDILCAWWIRHLVTAQPAAPFFSPKKTIHIMNLLDMRDALSTTAPSLLRPTLTHAYIGNCALNISSFWDYADFASAPLGHLAARIRADLVAQKTRAQIDAHWRLARPAVRKTGHLVLYGEADMLLCAFSNWQKGTPFDTDFGAAVEEGAGGGAGRKVVARPSYVSTDGKARGLVSVRNSGVCSGRDEKGNWWVGACLTPEAWAGVERALREMDEVDAY